MVLPPELVTNGEPPDGYLPWRLANGSEVLGPAYIGAAYVSRSGPYPVVVTALGDEPIIGRALIDRFTAILDHGRWVVVVP